jgi:hypothetical protein
MKGFKELLTAVAVTVAMVGYAHAQVGVPGSPAGPVNASGTIDKYVSFYTPDLEIGLPTVEGNSSIDWVSAANPAEIMWDANTHIELTIAPQGDLKTGSGVHQDTLPTTFLSQVKGRSVWLTNTSGALLTTDNGAYAAAQETPSSSSVTYVFGHGPTSGVLVNVKATRQGVDDHHGEYTTSANLSWVDLN